MAWILVLILVQCALGNSLRTTMLDKENPRIEMLTNLITLNLKTNGWNNMYFVGFLPDLFYSKVQMSNFTYSVTDAAKDTYSIEDVIPYHSNIIVISCLNFTEFEDTLLEALNSPYWHPLANIILYYHTSNKDELAKIFFIFWFYRAAYVIIVQYDDSKELFTVSNYNPYTSETRKLQYRYGCWKSTKLGRPITTFQESFMCEKGCHNVTVNSVLRASFLGTCIGIDVNEIKYGDIDALRNLNVFEDLSKNLHGYVFRAYAVQVKPFLVTIENEDGSYTPISRDGILWTETAQLMNFKIDLRPSKDVLNNPTFNFETNIQQIYNFAQRQVDLLLFPIYLFDIIIVEVDMSFPFKDSGVCVLSHRADFETILFDVNLLQDNYTLVLQFLLCFLGMWMLFFIYNAKEKNRFTPDQAGKEFINSIRNILSISLYNPPKSGMFRMFLFISIWSFFIINFATQAAIISFFSAFKTGKEVETFDDVIEKGYPVEGMASPDVMLPDDEEKFVKINSKLVPINDLFECIKSMSNDSHRFCLIDCSVGRYLERNLLNEKGEQYLHIARDRIHSHYLCMFFHKYSPLVDTFNTYLRIFVEAGLVKKWEEYRYTDIKYEAPIKALSFNDLLGIFECYGLLVGLSMAVFALEVTVGVIKNIMRYLRGKIANWKKTRRAKMKLKMDRKLGKIKLVNSSTQTISLKI